MSSFAYYRLATSVYTDSQFDQLCRIILEHWDEIDHPHKALLDKDLLEAGSGYAIRYPLMVENATMDWLIRNGKRI